MINKDPAGIDIGSGEHWVAVPGDRDEEPVRCFGCFTADLQAMARWLKACGVTTVAMESTGVTGMNIIRAIISGERDPEKLALMRARGVSTKA